MNNRFFYIVICAILISCGNDPPLPEREPTTAQTKITPQTDKIWNYYGVPDTISSSEMLPATVEVFTTLDNMRETFCDILNGDSVVGISISFPYCKEDNNFEPFLYTDPKGSSYVVNCPFVWVDLLAHGDFNEEGELVSLYYSSTIAPKYYGAILCNFRIALIYGGGVCSSCQAASSSKPGRSTYPITSAAFELNRIKEKEYNLILQFVVEIGQEERFYYYEYTGDIPVK